LIREVLDGRAEIKQVKLITKAASFITHTFTVLVDETKTVEEQVKDKFDWVNENITSKNFPKPAKGQKLEKEVFLFHFGKNMSSEAVIAEMDKSGYKPATIWDLLALALKEPNLQRKFWIVALGSSCELGGDRSVPCLDEGSNERRLSLIYSGDEWRGSGRFAGVRK
jgi:hypothetical protein